MMHCAKNCSAVRHSSKSHRHVIVGSWLIILSSFLYTVLNTHIYNFQARSPCFTPYHSWRDFVRTCAHIVRTFLHTLHEMSRDCHVTVTNSMKRDCWGVSFSRIGIQKREFFDKRDLGTLSAMARTTTTYVPLCRIFFKRLIWYLIHMLDTSKALKLL